MPPLLKLQVWFQKDNLDVALININVVHCTSELTQLQTKGQHVKQMKDNLHDEMGRRYIKKEFTDHIISKMRERFHETELLSSFGALCMRPLSHLSIEDLKSLGNDKLQTLISHYG